jgi:EAL domain-containing protein (putative c-di-GMP-specific phosphodiesterase class I)
MTIQVSIPNPGCKHCADSLGFDFTFAFQPIVNVEDLRVFAHEALVRGKDGQGAGWVLAQVTDANRYRFDQECRIRAINLAAKLGLATHLSINFMPNAVYQPEHCIRTTLEASRQVGFDIHKLIFEVLENEEVADPTKLKEIFAYYQTQG